MKKEQNEIEHDNKKKIFVEVVKSNLNSFHNRTVSNITDFIFHNSINHLTNDQVRNLAIAFYTKELTKRVLDLNESLIFKVKTNQ